MQAIYQLASTTTDPKIQKQLTKAGANIKTRLLENSSLTPRAQLILFNQAFIGEKIIWVRYLYRLAAHPCLTPKLQHKILALNCDVLNKILSHNVNLVPEIFALLFVEYKDNILQYFINNNCQYRNTKTQELFEKCLMLT